MDSAGTAPTAISQGPLLSQPTRIVNTFIDPVKTFTDLNRGNAWWMAFLLLVVVGYATVFGIVKQITIEKLVENQINSNPRTVEQMEKLTPEQRAQAMQRGVLFGKIFSYGFPASAMVQFLILAGIMMLIVNFGLGGSVGYGRSLAVTVYGFLPSVLKSLLMALMLFSGKVDPDNFNIQNPVATNLGFFVNDAEHHALFVLGTFIDVFNLWVCILLGLGFACVTKVKRGTAIGAILGIYLAWALIRTAIAAI
jgi:hypothetical protein